MKASFIAKKADIINKLSRELLEVNKLLVINKPAIAAKAIVYFNKQTSALMDKVAAANNDDELADIWLDFAMIMSAYVAKYDLYMDID